MNARNRIRHLSTGHLALLAALLLFASFQGVRALLDYRRHSLDAALFEAANDADPEQTEALLRAGANPNALDPDRYQRSVLAVAADRGDRATLEALLKAGADPNRWDPADVSPLMRAVAARNLPGVKALVTHGAHLNARRINQETALRLARTSGNETIVAYLKQLGAKD